MTSRLAIQEIGEGLAEGENSGGNLCPFCNGGGSGDHSLSVVRKSAMILYICHRDSCQAKGGIPAYGNPKRDTGPKERRVYVTSPSPLPDKHRDKLKDMYFLSDVELRRADVGWTEAYSPPGLGRVYMPVYNQQGKQRGYVCRDLYKEQNPKALSFVFRDDDTKLAWYLYSRTAPLVIVEDNISAIRASSYVNAVALQGTSISDDMVDEMIRSAMGPVYLCLDKDATRTAVKLSLRIRPRLVTRVVPLEKDLKDHTREELDDWMKTTIG